MAKTNYTLECMMGRKEYYALKQLFNLARLVNTDDYDEYLDYYIVCMPDEYYDALTYFEFVNEDNDNIMFREVADEVNDFVNRYYR